MKKIILYLLMAVMTVCVLAACAVGNQTKSVSSAESTVPLEVTASSEESAAAPTDGEVPEPAAPDRTAQEQESEEEKTEPSSKIGVGEETAGEGAEVPGAELTKLSYTVDYHRISPFLEEQYDEQTVLTAHKVIDAFLANETEVETPEMRRFEQEKVHSLVRILCPPFVAFCDVEYSIPIGSGETSTVFSWRYRMQRERMEEELASFEAAIDSYMADVYEEDTEAMKALSIYCAYGRELTYDYRSAEDDAGGLPMDEAAYRASPFCALTQHTGICYSISEGLMFLYNTVGINAGTVGSYEGAGAHEWTIAEIDGHYYYFDATWDINESEADSLMYFGITEEERADWAGRYPVDSVYFACTNEIHGYYDLSDTRFETIHGEQAMTVYSIELDHFAQTVLLLTDSGELFMDLN